MKSESKLDLPKIDENDGKKIEENKNNINNDNMTYFKKNIKALNNKLNDINNYFQTLFDNKDQDIAYIKKNIEEINLEF
jgi:predicted transcriptional regulator